MYVATCTQACGYIICNMLCPQITVIIDILHGLLATLMSSIIQCTYMHVKYVMVAN